MKKILIIGAGFLQDFVIQKSVKMGYETLAVDADPNAIGFKHASKYKVINIVDKEACLEYAMEEQIDGVLTAATDYGVLTVSYIAEKMHLPGLNYISAELIKNKYKVRKCLYENHVDDTEKAYEINSETDLKSLSQELEYPVIVKPCDGSGSRGISRVDNADDLITACQYAMEGSITHRAEIEKFIIGDEYGAETLVSNGCVNVLGIMKKYMTEPPYYAELGHSIPCGLPIEIEQKAIKCVESAVKALGINHGSVNMDMKITSDGKVHIIDIGARMGGNMIGPCIIPYGTGLDYVGNMIRNAVNDSLDWTVGKKAAVSSRLLAFKGGNVKYLPDFEILSSKNNVEIYHHIELNQNVNEYHTNLDGCGYVIACREDIDSAVSVAIDVLYKIENELF